MSRPGGFGGSVVISGVATGLLLIAITGARHPARLESRGAPPWPAPSARSVASGVHAAGLSLAAAAGVVTRYAVHLDVLVGGQAVQVPAGIGIDPRDGEAAPLTSGDGSGIIRVSSGDQAPVYTLGQVFDEWQVALAPSRLGGLPAGTVAAYVNGSRVGGDPGAVVLAPHQEIAVSYTPSGAAPPARPVPARYAFPAGT